MFKALWKTFAVFLVIIVGILLIAGAIAVPMLVLEMAFAALGASDPFGWAGLSLTSISLFAFFFCLIYSLEEEQLSRENEDKVHHINNQGKQPNIQISDKANLQDPRRKNGRKSKMETHSDGTATVYTKNTQEVCVYYYAQELADGWQGDTYDITEAEYEAQQGVCVVVSGKPAGEINHRYASLVNSKAESLCRFNVLEKAVAMGKLGEYSGLIGPYFGDGSDWFDGPAIFEFDNREDAQVYLDYIS